MTKNKIQEQRMRQYFIDAAKEILKGEGLACLNVRNVAEKAGYSYATLYNYFKDMRDLVFACVQEFQQECAEIIKVEKQNIPTGMEKIEVIILAYLKFFVQYPGIFDLFFLSKTNDIAKDEATINAIYTFLDVQCAPEWASYEGEIEPSKVMSEIKNTIYGMLLFYITRDIPADYHTFMSDTKNYLNKTLKLKTGED